MSKKEIKMGEKARFCFRIIVALSLSFASVYAAYFWLRVIDLIPALPFLR